MKKYFYLFSFISLLFLACANSVSPSNTDSPASGGNSGSTPSSSGSSAGASAVQDEKDYGPNSEEGRLSVEAVSDGIKVTIRLLDNENDTYYTNVNGVFHILNIDNCTITETKSHLELNVGTLMYDGNGREISAVFPFVEKGKKYTFQFAFSGKNDNETCVVPYHKEYATCTATVDGPKLADYFDYNYAPDTASLYADNMACVHLNKDVSKFIKYSGATDVYLYGSVINGLVDWTDSSWMTSWRADINYSEPAYYIFTVNYSEMLTSKGCSIGKQLFDKTYYASSFVWKNDYWGIDGKLFFTIDGKKYAYGTFKFKNADVDPVNWKKILATYTTNDSSKFTALPACTGTNPFDSSKTYVFYRGTSEEANVTMEDKGTYGIFYLTSKGKTEPYKVFNYTWDTNNKKIYTRVAKINGKTYEDNLTGSWTKDTGYYWTYSAIDELDYSFSGTTINIKNAEINSSNFQRLMFTRYGDGFKLSESGYSVYCGCEYIYIKAGATGTCYGILGFGNNTIIVCEYDTTNSYCGPKFEIPYSMNDFTKQLTLNYENSNYTLNYEQNTGNNMKFELVSN